MAIPKFSATLSLPKDPAVFQRDHNRALRAAYTHIAEFHHEKHVPRHFMEFAFAKYGYHRRSAKYLKRKARIVGSEVARLPLVYTGRTRAEVTKNRKVQATPKGSRLTVKIPIKGGSGRFLDAAARDRLGIKNPTVKQVASQLQMMKRVAELEAISNDEINTLSVQLENRYTELINAPTVKRRRRFRS